jgi:beta-glucanase (GH16 family)
MANPSPSYAPRARATETAWQLVWADEFTGDQIDPAKWEHEVNAWGGGNDELQYYTDRPENSFVRDGQLVIRARRETFTGPEGTREFTSARLRTKGRGDWCRGRFVVRAKVPVGQGVWPAIWMLPSESRYGIWPHSGEIDIMEIVGHLPETVHGTLHYFDPASQQHAYSGAPFRLGEGNFGEGFHEFAVEWDAGAMHWLIDGEHYQTQTAWRTDAAVFPAPFDQSFHLLLNVAVGGKWPGNPDETTELPQDMVVDYVRVYREVTS